MNMYLCYCVLVFTIFILGISLLFSKFIYSSIQLQLVDIKCMLSSDQIKQLFKFEKYTRIHAKYKHFGTISIIGPYTALNRASTYYNAKCVRRNHPALTSLRLSLLSLNWSGACRASIDIFGGQFLTAF